MLRHWFKDHRHVYVDPNDGQSKPDRRRAWQRIGPGQAVLYVLVIGMLIGGLIYVESVSHRFNQQTAKTECLRAALRPIVSAAAHIDGTPELERAEHAYLEATRGLRTPGRCPR